MNRDEADRLAVERINVLCRELEFAIQEATNRGLSVDQVMDSMGLYRFPSRPVRFRIERTIRYNRSEEIPNV